MSWLGSAFILLACTDFLLKDTEGGSLVGRSMDYDTVLPCRVERSSNKLSVRCLDLIVEGVNDQGLAVDLLWFSEAKYPKETENAIPVERVPDWLLDNFSNAQKAVRALQKIDVKARTLPLFGSEPPIHMAIHDSSGESYVVEFVEGVMQVHRNPIGVTGSGPAFPKKLRHLGTFFGKERKTCSQFVQIALKKHHLEPASNAEENLQNAWNLLKHCKKAQWTTVKDLTNGILYFHSGGKIQKYTLGVA